MLWETTQNHESAKVEIYALLTDVGFYLEHDVLGMLMQKIELTEPEDIQKRDLEFLFSVVTPKPHQRISN